MAMQPSWASLPQGLTVQQLVWVERWLGMDPRENSPSTPEYGAFVDDQGQIVVGNASPLATWAAVGSDLTAPLQLTTEAYRQLPETGVWESVFLDWATQDLDWMAFFQLWQGWEQAGQVILAGTVSLSWEAWSQWKHPGVLVVAEGLDLGPLRVVDRQLLTPVQQKTNQATSFLARAQALRQNAPISQHDFFQATLEELPMLPFTLKDWNNPAFAWPRGIEGLEDRRVKEPKPVEQTRMEVEEIFVS